MFIFITMSVGILSCYVGLFTMPGIGINNICGLLLSKDRELTENI